MQASKLSTPSHLKGLKKQKDVTGHRQVEALSRALNEINQAIHSTLDYDAVMQNAVSAASKALGSDSAALSLRAGNHWQVRYVDGFPSSIVGTEMDDEQEQHALIAAQTQKPVAICDAFNDERVNSQHMREWGIRSVLVVPVLLRGEAIGVIFFNYQRQSFEFKNFHLDFATQLAASISLALENAHLFRELENEIALHKRAEEALRNSEERFHTSVESLVEGFALLSTVRDVGNKAAGVNSAGQLVDLRYEYINEAGCRMIHMPREQVIGHTLLEQMPVLKENLFFDRYAAVIETGHPLVERIIEPEEGNASPQRIRRALDIRVVKVGDGIAMTWDEVTERLRAEMEHREALTQMEIHYRLIEQREKERQSIARDIHDGPVQTLSSINFNLQFIKEGFPDPALRLELDQISLSVKGAVQELRQIVNELRPPALIRFGLKKAIMVHAAEFPEKSPQIKWRFNMTDDGNLLPEHIYLTLFRIYQEAANNVIRHSEATKAWVNYRLKKDLAILEIRDNGKGLPEQYEVMGFTQNSHYGLAGIAERVAAVGGELVISSSPGQGTSIRVTVPIFQKKML